MDSAAQRSTAAMEPQVPGPGLPNPAPKKVATVQAQRVLCSAGVEVGELVFIEVSVQAGEVFKNLGVKDGGTDLVHAHGPFAQVNFAATV
jgi:hypothetical protein